MNKLIFATALFISFSAHASLKGDLTPHVNTFKKQTATLQGLMLEIEKIAPSCEAYKDRIEKELVAKSRDGRKRMDNSVTQMTQAANAVTAADAAKIADQVVAGLQKGYAEMTDAENQKNLRFVLNCARPGNPSIERKVDGQVAAFAAVLQTAKNIRSSIRSN